MFVQLLFNNFHQASLLTKRILSKLLINIHEKSQFSIPYCTFLAICKCLSQITHMKKDFAVTDKLKLIFLLSKQIRSVNTWIIICHFFHCTYACKQPQDMKTMVYENQNNRGHTFKNKTFGAQHLHRPSYLAEPVVYQGEIMNCWKCFTLIQFY